MNTTSRTRAPLIGGALFLSIAVPSAAIAETEATDAAKLSQNPVAAVISVPFQNNANLNAGPERDTLNVLNVQPVTLHQNDEQVERSAAQFDGDTLFLEPPLRPTETTGTERNRVVALRRIFLSGLSLCHRCTVAKQRLSSSLQVCQLTPL